MYTLKHKGLKCIYWWNIELVVTSTLYYLMWASSQILLLDCWFFFNYCKQLLASTSIAVDILLILFGDIAFYILMF